MSTRRTPVPAPEPATTSAALATLTGGQHRVQHTDIPIELIDPDPHNPEHRSTDIDEDLAASIEEDGVWTPVLLRPNTQTPGRWWLIAGHRRVLHARHVGLTEIPATLLPERTDLQALRTLLGENIHREDLRISEEAQLVQGLLDLGVPESDLVREVHKSATWVRSRRMVSRLPRDTQTLIDGRQITLGQVELIDQFADHPQIYERLIKHLGTDLLDWKIGEANRQLKDEAALAKSVDQLKAAGVKLLRKNARTQGPDRTHDRVGALGPGATARVGKRTTAKELKALVADNPDLTAVRHDDSWGRYIELVVPRRPEPEVDPAEAAAAAEREAADEAYRERLAIAEQEADVARALRVEFIAGILKGDRTLTREVIAELSALAVREAIADYNYGDGLRHLTDWLKLAGRLPDPEAEGALERAFASLPAGGPALTYLASRVEGRSPEGRWGHTIDGVVWERGFASGLAESLASGHQYWKTARAWYALLARLGYEASPAEREALARGAEQPAEDGSAG